MLLVFQNQLNLARQYGGDDADYLRRKKPTIQIRPKLERDLDDVLEIVEGVTDTQRVSENKALLKSALVKIKEIDPPTDYVSVIAGLQKAIKQVALNTAKHEGLNAAIASIAADIEKVVVELQRQRKEQEHQLMMQEQERKLRALRRPRERRDEECLIWLLN